MTERRICSLYHFLGTFVVVIPVLGMFMTGLLSFFRSNKSLNEENHFRAVVNFQISLVIYNIIVYLISPRSIGYAVVLTVAIGALMMMIYNGILAQKGGQAHYPLAIPFFKPAVKTLSAEEMMYQNNDQT